MSDLITREQRVSRAARFTQPSRGHAQPAGARGGGFIDFCGSTSIGWVLCGWISSDWDGRVGTPDVELRIGEETCTGSALMALYKRPDVENVGGRGFVVLLQHE